MTALFIKSFARDMRSTHAHVTGCELGFFSEFLELFNHRGAAREPKWKSGADIVVDDINLQLFAELAMIALLRFLEHRKIFVELSFVFEGGAIDALELRVLFVAFVIRARDAGELERADISGA